jgi:drug/metabolite transporter (DMT)-like permease
MSDEPTAQGATPLPLEYGREPGKRIDMVRLLARVLTVIVLMPLGVLCLYFALRDPRQASTGARVFMALCGAGFVGFGIGFICYAALRRRELPIVTEHDGR